MQVKKRNGSIVPFDSEFIVRAISLAAAAAGEHLLIPNNEALGLDAVVEGIAVRIGGGKGVLEGFPQADQKIQDQRPGKQGDDKGDKGSSLFHSVLSFCPLAGGWIDLRRRSGLLGRGKGNGPLRYNGGNGVLVNDHLFAVAAQDYRKGIKPGDIAPHLIAIHQKNRDIPALPADLGEKDLLKIICFLHM